MTTAQAPPLCNLSTFRIDPIFYHRIRKKCQLPSYSSCRLSLHAKKCLKCFSHDQRGPLYDGPALTTPMDAKEDAQQRICQQLNEEITSPLKEKQKNENGKASELFYVVKTSKDSNFDIDYLGESTKGDMNVRRELLHTSEPDGVPITLEGPIEDLARKEAREAGHLLRTLGIPEHYPQGIPSRGIFCSRTLNLRSITTIGYDMDYTLVQYSVDAWEGRAYKYGMDNLRSMGYPVDGLKFDPDLVIRGLIMDKDKGNLVKADRFGYVKRAMHGTKMISNRAISEMYGRELVDLRNESRWEFLNTLFSVSEAVMYMQMVERLDEGALPPQLGPLDYQGLHKVVARALFRAHVEGQLKAEIISEPERFVELDPELPLALLDQKEV